MISDKMKELVKNSSVIRAMFEEGKAMAKIYGAENVFDFSLGNPNVPAPASINQSACDIINTEDSLTIHGYMNNSGFEDVREKIAKSINKKYATKFTADNLLMSVGAAGGLNVILKTLLNPDDEVIVFAPFFGEYKNYVENFNGKLVVVPANTVDFQPDLSALSNLISPRTKAIIINTPNNPTGVVYSEDTIISLSKLLNDKQNELGISIYLISDEPYRELAYDNIKVPYLTKYYKNTIIGYSFSKSLSMPGDRIGYLVMPNELDDFEDIKNGANVANRILGFVNAPALQQKIVARCCDETTDVEYYNTNRELLYNGLIELGFECVKPQGAFYLFLKSPVADEKDFCKNAKKYNLLIVPGSSFGCSGYVRIAYCVSTDTIKRALPAFKKLAKDYNLI